MQHSALLFDHRNKSPQAQSRTAAGEDLVLRQKTVLSSPGSRVIKVSLVAHEAPQNISNDVVVQVILGVELFRAVDDVCW